MCSGASVLTHTPTHARTQRILSIATAFGEGWELEKIRSLSNIDPWFLNRLKDINDFNAVLETYKDKHVDHDDLLKAKQVCVYVSMSMSMSMSKTTCLKPSRSKFSNVQM
jgi:hypothetical protein